MRIPERFLRSLIWDLNGDDPIDRGKTWEFETAGGNILVVTLADFNSAGDALLDFEYNPGD